ncbi:hypothetical protein LTS15_004910 [Exophiala xenobiotica]|nr:hypothetical protein LTS15_004910 [Exophiala xenobiotica]
MSVESSTRFERHRARNENSQVTRSGRPSHIYEPQQSALHISSLQIESALYSKSRDGPSWGLKSSAAAARIEEEPDSFDHDRETPSPFDDGSRTDAAPTDAPRRTGYRARRWEPKRTAKLGVNSLGKPAEVLILPSRDRRIPLVPQDDGVKEDHRAVMQRALDLEKEPLRLKELQTNIEQTRTLIEKQRGQLDMEEWSTLRKHLVKGFTWNQLKLYLVSYRDRFRDRPVYDKEKSVLAKFIVEDIWGFTTPAAGGADGEADVHATKKRGTLTFTVKEDYKMDYLLTDDSQYLKTTSEEFQVQIDVFRTQRKIQIHGLRARANKALDKLSRLLKDLQVTGVQLREPSVGDTYSDPTLKPVVAPFLRSVAQKFNVHIDVTPQAIRILHRKRPDSAEHARREIRLAAVSEPERWQKVILQPPVPVDQPAMIPYPTPAELSWGLYQLPWTRLVASSISPQSTDMDAAHPASPDSILGNIEKWLQNPLTWSREHTRKHLQYDLAVKFGKALFRDTSEIRKLANKDDAERGSSSQDGALTTNELVEAETINSMGSSIGEETNANEDSGSQKENASNTQQKSPGGTESGASSYGATTTRHTSLALEQPDKRDLMEKISSDLGKPSFVGEIPHLIQQLAPLREWKPQKEREAPEVDPKAGPILRLELGPTTEVTKFPKLEVIVTAMPEEGRKPKLSIARLSAIFGEKSCTVLCPDREVDMKISGKLRRDLWQQGTNEDKLTLPLMTSIRRYVASARRPNATDWVFSPFVPLTFLSNTHDSLEAHRQKVNQALMPSVQSKSTKKDERNKSQKLEYMLQSVDAVDADSRSISVEYAGVDKKENLCLEHVTLTGANATRQELRLAERPYLSPPTSQSPNVRLLAQAGLELLKRLGQDPTKTTLTQLGEDIRLAPMPPVAGAADHDVQLIGTSAERRKAKRLATAKKKGEQSFEETPQELVKEPPTGPATGSTVGSDSKSDKSVKAATKSPEKQSSKIPKKQLAKQSSDKRKAAANDEAKGKSNVEKSKKHAQDRTEPEPKGEQSEKPTQGKSHVPKVKSSRAWKKKN